MFFCKKSKIKKSDSSIFQDQNNVEHQEEKLCEIDKRNLEIGNELREIKVLIEQQERQRKELKKEIDFLVTKIKGQKPSENKLKSMYFELTKLMEEIVDFPAVVCRIKKKQAQLVRGAIEKLKEFENLQTNIFKQW